MIEVRLGCSSAYLAFNYAGVRHSGGNGLNHCDGCSSGLGACSEEYIGFSCSVILVASPLPGKICWRRSRVPFRTHSVHLADRSPTIHLGLSLPDSGYALRHLVQGAISVPSYSSSRASFLRVRDVEEDIVEG